MLDLISSFQNTPYGSVILGAIGSILAVVILKVVSLIAKGWIPEFFANIQALKTFHEITIKSQRSTDTLFLLITYSLFAILCLVISIACAIRITIYEMVINYAGYKLLINYSVLFLSFYGFFVVLTKIESLVVAVTSKHGIDFMGNLGTNNANSADAKKQRD